MDMLTKITTDVRTHPSLLLKLNGGKARDFIFWLAFDVIHSAHLSLRTTTSRPGFLNCSSQFARSSLHAMNASWQDDCCSALPEWCVTKYKRNLLPICIAWKESFTFWLQKNMERAVVVLVVSKIIQLQPLDSPQVRYLTPLTFPYKIIHPTGTFMASFPSLL